MTKLKMNIRYEFKYCLECLKYGKKNVCSAMRFKD